MGGKFTRFIPRDDIKTLKQWILSIKTKGKLFLDKGAIEALNNHKSLLPAGVIKALVTLKEVMLLKSYPKIMKK